MKIGDYFYAPNPTGPILVQVLSITEDDKVIIRMQCNGQWIRTEPIPMHRTRAWEPAQPEVEGAA